MELTPEQRKQEYFDRARKNPAFRAAAKAKGDPTDLKPFKVANPEPDTVAAAKELQRLIDKEFGK